MDSARSCWHKWEAGLKQGTLEIEGDRENDTDCS